jgi:hypothetical protein
VRNALRLAALVLSLLLVVCLFQLAFHSVHHLGNAHASPECVVAFTAGHLAGVGGLPAVHEPILVAAAWVDVERALGAVQAAPLGLNPGRSPPSAPSV